MIITVNTSSAREVVDITGNIEHGLSGNGLVNVLARHTTAAITTADLDPGTDDDLLDALQTLTPQQSWHHPHDPKHFPDHLWSSLIGTNRMVPFKDGKLQLGTWQRLVLIELNGPRERRIDITVISV